MSNHGCPLSRIEAASKRFVGLLAGAILAATVVAASPVVFGSSSTAFADTPAAGTKLIEGTTISVMGDSISTYTGWSDVNPITDETCVNRYGEAYYGPEGGDFHNTDLLVTDTWWHQAATELGAEILISNAGNSTGVFYASYPANAAWDLYLKEMLAWKSRPYYLGTADEDPDIIALYIGSNEVARLQTGDLGSIEEVNFDTLIAENEDGSFTYAEPVTVTEAYCIMLHKISVTYPDAEVYCFTCVPNAGGYLSTVNKRLPSAIAFNGMVKEVAAYHGLTVVDLYEAFGLDADGDGKLTQEEFDAFHPLFNNDPHPNAAGFDVITNCFVETVLANSKYVVTEDEGNVEESTETRVPALELGIPLSGEESASAYGAAKGVVGVAGDQKESDDDLVYDYTITTVVGQGVMTIATNSIDVVNTAGKLSGDLTYVNNTTVATGDNGLIAESYAGKVSLPEDFAVSDGYEYEYVGSEKFSRYWAAMLIADESVAPEGEEPIYVSEDGETKLYSMHKRSALEGRKFTVPNLYLGFDEPIEGSWPAQYDSVQHFVLADSEGNTVTTYCADLMTRAVEGYEYNVCDIETGTYYTDEDAAMIRAVAYNGYWGTDSGFGSLSAMKDMMRASGEFTEEEIELLNDGIALTATQYAIWTNSNSLHKRVFVNAYYATSLSMAKGIQADQSEVALLFKVYRYLLTLPPVEINEFTTSNSIIESSSFLKGASLMITGKPADNPANQDDDAANDVYTVDLTIELKHEMEEGNGDDLSLVIMNGDEQVVDGRIAGELTEGQQQLSVENGEVVISGITLQEGEGDYLSVSIEGSQNLDKGVYLFTSEVRDGVSSQTMVGVAEGERTVNAMVGIDFDFTVEDEVVTVERHWSAEEPEAPIAPEEPEAPAEPEASDDAALGVTVPADPSAGEQSDEPADDSTDAEGVDSEAPATPAEPEEEPEEEQVEDPAKEGDKGGIVGTIISLLGRLGSFLGGLFR